MKRFDEIKPYGVFKLKLDGTPLIKLDEERYLSPAGCHKIGDKRRKVYDVQGS